MQWSDHNVVLFYDCDHNSHEQVLKKALPLLGINSDTLCIKKMPNGKPYLNLPISCSYSHTNNIVLYALSKSRYLGVDIECYARTVKALKLAKRFLTLSEYQQVREAKHPNTTFLDIWTQKEAYLKATGQGLSNHLKNFTITLNKININHDIYTDNFNILAGYSVGIATDIPNANIVTLALHPQNNPAEDSDH